MNQFSSFERFEAEKQTYDASVNLNLSLLEMQDAEFKSLFSRRGHSDFEFGNKLMDGLVLSRTAIPPDCSNEVSLVFCDDCLGSLKRSKMPRFALANGLYRGVLPERFATYLELSGRTCMRYIRANCFSYTFVCFERCSQSPACDW